MTARDTHELRLDRWPRLSTFPTTNGIIVGAIALDFITAAAMIFGRPITGDWLLFLAALHGVGTGHFAIKRKTDFRNGNGDVKPSPSP